MLAFFLDFFELSFIVIPLVGPVADKLGIDLIWFGVLLGVNMQTSFMHPPFGFALFYLRSVAPAKDYVDKVTGKLTARVTTGQIYWGAVPFVLIQILMVALIIAFPQHGPAVYKAKEKTVDIQQDPDRGARRTSRRRATSRPRRRPDSRREQDDATKALREGARRRAKAPRRAPAKAAEPRAGRRDKPPQKQSARPAPTRRSKPKKTRPAICRGAS